MITNEEERDYGLGAIDFGLHIVYTENGYTVLYGEPKEYPIGGILTEFVQISPTDIKEAIMECKDFFEIELDSEGSGNAFHVFEKALKQRFGMATSALICTEFLSVLSDWNKAVKGNRMDELKEIMNKSESPEIKEFIFKDTGYTDVGFDSFGQFLLTAYLRFSSIICTVKYTFAGLMNDNDSYGPVDADRAYSLIGSMCSDMIAMQHIDFRIIALDGAFRKMYSINSVFSLLLFEVINCTEKEVTIKKCKNCNKYFIPEGRKDTLYCAYPSPQDKEKTCREIGAQVARANKEKTDVVTQEYRKRYLTHKMKVRRHPGDIRYIKVLNELTVGMKEWRLKLKEGSATTEQFLEWIKNY